MNPVRTIVTTLLPARSQEIRALLRLLADSGGCFGSAAALAQQAGFQNRYQMGRTLTAEGLPPVTELVGWIRVLRWSFEWDTTGQTPCASALREGLDPASRYRSVLDITGAHWTDVKQHGLGWVTLKLLGRCYRRPAADDSAVKAVSGGG